MEDGSASKINVTFLWLKLVEHLIVFGNKLKEAVWRSTVIGAAKFG